MIVAWPTKMALAPALADALINELDKDGLSRETDRTLPDWMYPGYASFPWDEAKCWSLS